MRILIAVFINLIVIAGYWSSNTAVHADMLMWHTDESVETAALQLLNVMFSVPQISVRLAKIPKEHFKMIAFYTDYWTSNKAILLESEIKPFSPLQNYPKIEGRDKDKVITILYDELVVSRNINSSISFDVINAKTSGKVYIDISGKEHGYQYQVYNCMGELVEERSIDLGAGTYAYNVPPSGMITYTPAQ